MEIPSDGNMGIPRSKMPQIKSRDYPEFVDYLSSNGATFSKETVPASSLKPVQNEFSKAGVLKAMQKELDGVGDKPWHEIVGCLATVTKRKKCSESNSSRANTGLHY